MLLGCRALISFMRLAHSSRDNVFWFATLTYSPTVRSLLCVIGHGLVRSAGRSMYWLTTSLTVSPGTVIVRSTILSTCSRLTSLSFSRAFSGVVLQPVSRAIRTRAWAPMDKPLVPSTRRTWDRSLCWQIFSSIPFPLIVVDVLGF